MSMIKLTYDVHGWLTSVVNGEFQERLYYADGLDGGCWNGNISTFKWKASGDNSYEGYNLKYDGYNRLYSAVYGSGNNLADFSDYFNEHVEYDCNSNITKLRRRGLVDNINGGFGLVDNLSMTYVGNMLTSVCDSASRYSYAGATDFDGVPGQEYPLTYNGNQLTGVTEASADYDFAGSFEYKRVNGSQYLYNANGSLIADKSRGIAYITYAPNGTPQKIYFTNGNVTKYRYSATGQKLSVEYYVAAPNVTVPFGTEPDALTQGQTMYAGSREYLLGGSLVMEDGMIDKFLFDGGYAQASFVNPTTYNFSFYYYNQDHLGNNREVVDSAGTVKQVTNYYPFGAPYTESSAVLNASLQPYKYNGKELDRMHGLDTYDYGARQYAPILGRWDRMDPLCEKYYSVSPYAYCHNNPVMMVDPDGRDGIATIDYENKTINISQTFYYNKNSEDLYKNYYIKDIKINNKSYGQIPITAEINLLDQKGFSSQTWNVNDGSNDWSVSFSYNFIPLDSDNEVENALVSDLAANALCFNNDLTSNGGWDPNPRKIYLGPNKAGWSDHRGETFIHEIGHSWGLPHEKYMPKSPIFGDENNGKGMDSTGIMGNGNHRAIQQYEVEYGVLRILNEILLQKNII